MRDTPLESQQWKSNTDIKISTERNMAMQSDIRAHHHPTTARVETNNQVRYFFNHSVTDRLL
jgi:hypothetical protein